MTKNNKATKVMKFLSYNYNWGNRDVAKHLGVSEGYVWMLRKQVTPKVEALIEDIAEAPMPVSANDIQMGGNHYKQSAIQPWDVFDTWPTEQRIGAYRANCTKYVMRLDSKDTPLLNAQKLAHYAQKLVEVLEQAQ